MMCMLFPLWPPGLGMSGGGCEPVPERQARCSRTEAVSRLAERALRNKEERVLSSIPCRP